MKFKKLVACFNAPDITVAEELICDIFFSFNLKGVVCDVPIEEPDEGFGAHTLPTPDIYSVTGFLPMLDTTDITIGNIIERLTALAALDIQVKTSTQTVDEKEWADAWKQYFEVTRVTDKIVIKPEWKEYTPKPGEIIIHLDPGMAFGTGTHPTTFMCLQMIETYLAPGTSFLDVGTGSGILMVAAAKLGASRLVGIDNDAVAIQVADENLKKNNLTTKQPEVIDLQNTPGKPACELVCTTVDQTEQGPFNLIAANIIAQVIVDILPQISYRMDSQSVAVLSGIITERRPDVLDAIASNHLTVIKETVTDEWVALAIKKKRR